MLLFFIPLWIVIIVFNLLKSWDKAKLKKQHEEGTNVLTKIMQRHPALYQEIKCSERELNRPPNENCEAWRIGTEAGKEFAEQRKNAFKNSKDEWRDKKEEESDVVIFQAKKNWGNIYDSMNEEYTVDKYLGVDKNLSDKPFFGDRLWEAAKKKKKN